MSEGRQDTGGGAALPAAAAAIAAGYTFTGPALDLGALLWEGTAHPGARVALPLSVLNRHGLVAGATGTGKTKTLQIVAEQLSAQGVPVFLADVKGDLSGIAAPGAGGDRVRQRAADVGQQWRATGFPAEFYALGGLGSGIPVRASETNGCSVTTLIPAGTGSNGDLTVSISYSGVGVEGPYSRTQTHHLYRSDFKPGCNKLAVEFGCGALAVCVYPVP